MEHRYSSIQLFLLLSAPIFGAEARQHVPSFFFENLGLTKSEIRFILEGPRYHAYFQNDTITYRTSGTETVVRFVGSDRQTKIEAGQDGGGRLNFLLGTEPSRWKTNLVAYSSITYKSLYPGIDVRYRVDGDGVKADYIVAPHAEAGRIRIEYRHARKVEIDEKGDLVVTRGNAILREQAPVIYQLSSQGAVRIGGSFRIFADRTVGFALGPYDSSETLIIDPTVAYATFFGGGLIGSINGLATDTSGNAYVAGWTESLNLPISGPAQASNRGGVDAFVAKLNAAGTALLYGTYIGGSSDDRALAIAVDSSGQAYVTGSTMSSNFPLASAVKSSLGGGCDAFAIKLNASGSAFVYSTFLGGSSWDQGTAIAVDSSGNAYIAGDTQSTDFPVASAVQAGNGGLVDAFVTKLSATGAIQLSTYLGGSGAEHAGGIAIDSSKNIYVAGGTGSANFPTTAGLRTTLSGLQDAFVTKISASGTSISYSTFLGGTGGSAGAPEQVNAIAVSSSGLAYVAGITSSVDFPVTSGVLRATGNGFEDSFVAKLNATGTIAYATYLGGTTSNCASGIAIDAAGDAYVAGQTSSVDFPVSNGLQGFGGNYDAFVAVLNPTATGILFATFFGGSGSDTAGSIALDSNANIYVAGQTNSSDLPVVAAYQNVYPGMATGWVAKIGAVTSGGGSGGSGGSGSSGGSGGSGSSGASGPTPTGVLRNQSGSLLLSTYAQTTLVNSGGVFASDPASSQDSSGRTYVTAGDTYNSIWANVYNPGTSTWTGWTPGGGQIRGVPSIAVAPNGDAWIGTRDSYTSYWLVKYNPSGGFGAWISLLGLFSTDPVVAACGDGSIYVIGKDTYNSLWSGRYIPGTGFQGWVSGGGIVTGKPSATCGTDNAVYIAVEDFYNSNWIARVAGNTWTGWYFGGAITSITPRIASLGNGSIAVVILDPTSVVYRTTFTQGTGNGWQPWSQLGGIVADIAPAASGGGLYLFGRTSDTNLWWYQQSANLWTSIGNSGVTAGAISASPR